MTRWMIYGATGYTGQLLAEEALRRGERPTLAGRSPEKLRALADRTGLPAVAAPLDDPRALRAAVEGHALVFHAAGPFVHTAEPMVQACLAAGAHYLDLSGEVASIEPVLAAERDEKARARGVLLLPAAGFDVIPTDCLAAHVAGRIAEPASVEIALAALGRPSAGTLKSSLEILGRGGLLRRDGALVPARIGGAPTPIRFSDRPRPCLAFPGADLSTAYRSTGARDVTVYLALSGALRRARPLLPLATRVLRSSAIRAALGRAIERSRTGPSEAYLARGHSRLWARARNARGDVAEGWLDTMEGYRFTAIAGVAAVVQLLGAASPPTGALTPAQALGADFVLGLPETRRLDRLEDADG